MGRTSGNARRPFRWMAAVGLGLGAVGTGVFWARHHRTAAPGIVGPFIPPWSTRMTGIVGPGKKVSWTFTMVNRKVQSLTVKPWTRAFHLILTPMGGGNSIVLNEAFPKVLTLPTHQSRHWTVTSDTSAWLVRCGDQHRRRRSGGLLDMGPHGVGRCVVLPLPGQYPTHRKFVL